MKRLLLSLALAALLVGVALHRVEAGALLHTLVNVSLPLLGVALSIQIVILLIKAQRWAVALRAATGQAVRGTVTASLIGFAGNLVVPARLGEVVRAELVAQRNHLPCSLAITTIAVTQFFDLLLLGAVSLLYKGIGVHELYGQVKTSDRNKPALPEEYTRHADRTVPGFESPVQAARTGASSRPTGRLRELHVHPGAERSGL